MSLDQWITWLETSHEDLLLGDKMEGTRGSTMCYAMLHADAVTVCLHAHSHGASTPTTPLSFPSFTCVLASGLTCAGLRSTCCLDCTSTSSDLRGLSEPHTC
eukprot:1161642-Pelagomonas_calceolata.AAC.1